MSYQSLQARQPKVSLMMPHQSGVSLITSLLMLVMLTLLALSMFRGFGMEQKIAGNTREKERSYQAAESSLQYGEWWLTQVAPGTGVACVAPVTIASTADMRTCSNALTTPGDPSSWAGVSNYLPPSMMVATGGGVATDGNGNKDINYASTPGLYVSYLGLSPSGQQMLYSVTAAGYGGSANTTSVIQSVFATSAKAVSLDTP